MHPSQSLLKLSKAWSVDNPRPHPSLRASNAINASPGTHASVAEMPCLRSLPETTRTNNHVCPSLVQSTTIFYLKPFSTCRRVDQSAYGTTILGFCGPYAKSASRAHPTPPRVAALPYESSPPSGYYSHLQLLIFTAQRYAICIRGRVYLHFPYRRPTFLTPAGSIGASSTTFTL